MEHIGVKQWAALQGINHFTARRYASEGRVSPPPTRGPNGELQFAPDAVVLPKDTGSRGNVHWRG